MASVASFMSLQAKWELSRQEGRPLPAPPPPLQTGGLASVGWGPGLAARPLGEGASCVHGSRRTSLGIKVINFPLSRAGTQTEIKSA